MLSQGYVLLFYHYVPNFYVSGTAEDQWFSPVPCDEVCQWNCRRSVVFSCFL